MLRCSTRRAQIGLASSTTRAPYAPERVGRLGLLPDGRSMADGARRVELVGHIGAAGFASGDRVVIGAWTSGPVGPMTDVMWARPNGERVLLAPSDAAAEFIASVYRFERVDVVDVRGAWDGHTLAVDAGPLRVRLDAGRGW